MSNLPWVPRLNATKVVSVTPTISAASYSSGNQIGGIMQLSDVIRQESNAGFGTSELVGVTILDKAAQSIAIDLFLFNVSPILVSTNNTAFDLTDANLALQCIGIVSVGTAYSASSSNSASSTQNLNKVVQIAGTSSAPTSVFAVAVARAAATYTSTSDLVFQFEFFMD